MIENTNTKIANQNPFDATFQSLSNTFTIKDIATFKLAICHHDEQIKDVLHNQEYEGFDHIPVINETGVVVGVVENAESDEFARNLFRCAIRSQMVVPKLVHADNGAPMRGVSLGAILGSQFVTRSYSRPRRSNDNAY
jgi:CBS-domain-containing membrane protein